MAAKRKPLYTKALDERLHRKIDKLVKETNLPKWRVIEDQLKKSFQVN